MDGRNFKSIIDAQVRSDGVTTPKGYEARYGADDYGGPNSDVACNRKSRDARKPREKCDRVQGEKAPAAGVMAASPATEPFATAMKLGLPPPPLLRWLM